jgi:hypothetical protein
MSKWMTLMVLAAMTTALPARGAQSPASKLTTIAEQSGFKRTGRFDEVERLCAAFQDQYPKSVRCIEFGRTPEGRRMLALIASGDATFDAAGNRAKRRAVVLMQGGIHAGEIDGKDAGFLALRQILDGRTSVGVLDRVTFVFVPVFNVDGHERFGRWNRPNQVGPEEMGWRVTAQNLNLNRDYVKAEAPEIQAMLRLLNEWDPILYADLHVTDGAEFEHDISINVAPTLTGDSTLRASAMGVRDELVQRLKSQGSLPLDFYPSLIRDDDPSSGFAVTISPPRFSQEYWAKRNRIGVLVETHSWKDYPTRVRITRNSIVAMLEMTAAKGATWQAAAADADRRALAIGGQPVALAFGNTEHSKTIDFRGYAYTRTQSPVSGALMTRYDNKRPQIWRIPLFDEVKATLTVAAPRGGYIIPAAQAALVATKLDIHGLSSRRLANAAQSMDVQVFRAVKAKLAPETFEGRAVLTVTGDWQPEKREIPAGSLFVPIAQPRAELVMTLLEPRAPDSLVSWGFFNAAFERKEYMESYVAEAVAEDMLKDPAVRAEFEKRVASDPEFAKSPTARLDFFYARHPSWDDRYNLYPVYRTDQDLQ